jgi:hypothetical protein
MTTESTGPTAQPAGRKQMNCSCPPNVCRYPKSEICRHRMEMLETEVHVLKRRCQEYENGAAMQKQRIGELLKYNEEQVRQREAEVAKANESEKTSLSLQTALRSVTAQLEAEKATRLSLEGEMDSLRRQSVANDQALKAVAATFTTLLQQAGCASPEDLGRKARRFDALLGAARRMAEALRKYRLSWDSGEEARSLMGELDGTDILR